MTYRFSADAVTPLYTTKDGDNRMQQMIREFENILNMYRNNQIMGINAAMKYIVGTYTIDAANSICPYISKRLGIAEWIVRIDMMQRYMQKEEETVEKSKMNTI